MPSSDFQKIIRDLSCISEKLEIKSVGSELIFKCRGQFAEAEIRRTESDGNMEFLQKQDIFDTQKWLMYSSLKIMTKILFSFPTCHPTLQYPSLQ